MSTVNVQIAPDIEFIMSIDIPGVTEDSRDYELQQHKAEIYAKFEERLKSVFPEGLKIDTFQFGINKENQD